MWTIRTTFLAPAQGHYEYEGEKKTFVFDTPPAMITRDMNLRLEQAQAVELVKRWNDENVTLANQAGMRPTYHAALIED